MDIFDFAWKQLEEAGMCDAKGSKEYKRLRQLWEREGAKLMALAYIATHANAPVRLEADPTTKTGAK